MAPSGYKTFWGNVFQNDIQHQQPYLGPLFWYSNQVIKVLNPSPCCHAIGACHTPFGCISKWTTCCSHWRAHVDNCEWTAFHSDQDNAFSTFGSKEHSYACPYPVDREKFTGWCWRDHTGNKQQGRLKSSFSGVLGVWPGGKSWC